MEAPHEPIILGPGEGRTFPFGRRIMITKVDEEEVTIIPRCAKSSSTSRKLSEKWKYSHMHD